MLATVFFINQQCDLTCCLLKVSYEKYLKTNIKKFEKFKFRSQPRDIKSTSLYKY